MKYSDFEKQNFKSQTIKVTDYSGDCLREDHFSPGIRNPDFKVVISLEHELGFEADIILLARYTLSADDREELKEDLKDSISKGNLKLESDRALSRYSFDVFINHDIKDTGSLDEKIVDALGYSKALKLEIMGLFEQHMEEVRVINGSGSCGIASSHTARARIFISYYESLSQKEQQKLHEDIVSKCIEFVENEYDDSEHLD